MVPNITEAILSQETQVQSVSAFWLAFLRVQAFPGLW